MPGVRTTLPEEPSMGSGLAMRALSYIIGPREDTGQSVCGSVVRRGTWTIVFTLAGAAIGEVTVTQPVQSSHDDGESRVSPELNRLCQKRAEVLYRQLGSDCCQWVDPPFVLCGDLTERRLIEYGRLVVRHAAEALWRQYFKRRPTDPSTVLLFGSGASYRGYARRLFGDEHVPYYGYYKPELRTVLMNISTGGGTLIHELTHALIEYDFPAVPDWLNEGLASLYEQCNSEAWKRGELAGDENWRLPALQKAIADRQLRPLRELITRDDFRGAQETLNYAQARYFCMYMQKRNVLIHFYASFRDGFKEDRTGLSYVEEALGGRRLEVIDREFRDWVMGLRWHP